jgi:hypothetical protein
VKKAILMFWLQSLDQARLTWHPGTFCLSDLKAHSQPQCGRIDSSIPRCLEMTGRSFSFLAFGAEIKKNRLSSNNPGRLSVSFSMNPI